MTLAPSVATIDPGNLKSHPNTPYRRHSFISSPPSQCSTPPPPPNNPPTLSLTSPFLLPTRGRHLQLRPRAPSLRSTRHRLVRRLHHPQHSRKPLLSRARHSHRLPRNPLRPLEIRLPNLGFRPPQERRIHDGDLDPAGGSPRLNPRKHHSLHLNPPSPGQSLILEYRRIPPGKYARPSCSAQGWFGTLLCLKRCAKIRGWGFA